ncbi:MAG: helix-turn-helix domain-containing protein [Bacteroidetes bacterium]|nr:helix-turn-helix domain-containing protein [Bacteroidota bacterium]
MKHISILVPKGAILGSVEGPRLLLSQVNNLLSSKGISPLFKIELIGLTKETPLSGGLFTAHSDHTIDEIRKTDLIIIPAIDGDLKNAIEENKAFIPWITDRYKQGSEIASLCLGAFLLASTGLLNGKKCATHWAFENQFREMFPDVNLVPEKVRELAILCSKIFAIEIERNSQSAFNIFQGQKEHGDEPIKTAQEFIESNFSEKITVDQLASRLALGRRNMERRFKKATSNTVVEYIQRVKVEAAKKGFETSRKNINEVMMDVGYSDIKAFRTVFKRITGLSPVEYKNKYNYN